MTVPFMELKSDSGLPGFRGNIIVVYAIFETKKQHINKRYNIIFSIREIESYSTSVNI